MSACPLCPSFVRASLTILVVIGLVSPVSAAVFAGGEYLVFDHSSNTVFEYSADNEVQSSVTLSYPDGGRGPNRIGGGVVDRDGNLHVYNGVFQPYLSTIDAQSGGQTDREGVGFSSVNNIANTNLTSIDHRVFAIDNSTTGSDENGIVLFDRSADYASQRFATSFQPNDLAAGHDGRLYALGTTGSGASANPDEIQVYDPNTLASLSSISLPNDTVGESVTGIEVTSAGEIFAATRSGLLARLDAGGNIVQSLDIVDLFDTDDLNDLDLRADGRLLVGGRLGEIYFSDTSLESATALTVNDGSTPVHVAWTDVTAVPEPGSVLFIGAMLGGVLWHRRRIANGGCRQASVHDNEGAIRASDSASSAS